ncbi:N(4)-(beta-N-acetylglucosaminyl)-L-asparaginase [Rhodothermus profundi]|uniref:N4-(Beta-N-acetylglucosaminyl)-L-asparaginase n=1 Tax=Rhodothermus profundi TaxID=633813 RepID=A0A1M6SPL4_9BACT|nr:N(4)-(beta-N-acetylglucosaminyl)-L-asparaginase [Rhodothermus profundi]SHK46570.1 N4-(beta-N-acetylglucosaminyl)-L-asparaginase [Rhodothermus profundi]
MRRREVIQLGLISGLLGAFGLRCTSSVGFRRPVAVATWNHGQQAVEAAWRRLQQGGSLLDAVEAGVRVVEADPSVRTVGLGGYPDATGRVTLDASIMEGTGRCGAVAFLEGFVHPVSIARRVMEKTPHVFLVGEGAQDFARAEGFEETNLLTPAAAQDWQRWKARQARQTPPPPNLENTNRIDATNHDTVGLLMVDEEGRLAGACSTSGAAFKLRGRVGDSPIIGAGLFVDDEVGAACATGWGEGVIRIAGSHLVVELMRQGDDPEVACRKAVQRYQAKSPGSETLQVGFLALRRDGAVGAYSLRPGFTYAVKTRDQKVQLLQAPSLLR